MRYGNALGLTALLVLALPSFAQDPLPIGQSMSGYGGGGAPGTPCPSPAAPPLELPANLPTAWVEDPCPCEPYNMYFALDYVTYWINNDQRPLVTSSTAPFPLNNSGALGQTNTVFVDPGADAQNLNGARATIGLACIAPIEISGMYLYGDRRRSLNSDANGNPLFSRPIQLAQDLSQTSFLGSFPGLTHGYVATETSTTVATGEANVFLAPFLGDVRATGYVLDFHIGGRYFYLAEDMTNEVFQQTFSPFAAVAFGGGAFGPPGANFAQDIFKTRNHWYGGQFGIRSTYAICDFLIFDAKSNFGFGNNRQIVEIGGASALFNATPAPLALPGGIQAVPSNSGRFVRDVFSAYVDFTLTLEVPLTEDLRFNVGYNILFLSHMARPGEFLNNIVDTRQVPTDQNFIPGFVANQPGFTWHDTDFFAQGLSVGLSYRY
ncbi:MAG: BBP7 family outer membrane beta-barrel protein [Gemmataceae bacterium]